MRLRLKKLDESRAETAFNAYYYSKEDINLILNTMAKHVTNKSWIMVVDV